MRERGPGAQVPQPIGSSGQLGKGNSCHAEDLFSQHGVGFGHQTAHLTQERAQSLLNCLNTLSDRMVVPLKLFQRLLGHMAGAAAIVPLGLLHMRPLQHWLHGRVPRWAWRRGTHHVQITPACCKIFSPWTDPSFFRAGVPLEQACCGIHGCLGHRLGSHVQQARSVSGMDGSPTALAYQLPRVAGSTPCLSRLRGRLWGKDVLVRTDNTATVGISTGKAVTTPPIASRNLMFDEMFDQSRAFLLQQGLERRLSPSTLKVYVAAIPLTTTP